MRDGGITDHTCKEQRVSDQFTVTRDSGDTELTIAAGATEIARYVLST